MKRVQELCLVLLVTAVAFNLGIAQTFQDQPITVGLHEMTAYPLNGGEVQIGDLLFPFSASQLRWIAIDYGLTNDFQVGTALVANFYGTLNLLAKYRIHLSSSMDFALPLSLGLTLGEARELVIGSALIFSGMLGEDVGYHAGLWVSASNPGGFGVSALYAIVDVNILPADKLLFELDFYPSTVNPVQLSIGELQRFGFLNLTVTATLALPSNVNALEADIFFRF